MPTKNQKELTKNVIKYVLYRLGSNGGGRTKLMKLMFLIDYYDPENDQITLKSRLGNRFIIYNYGIFSFEVFDSLVGMIRNNEIKEVPFKLAVNSDISDFSKALDKNLKVKIDKIIEKFGKLTKEEIDKKTIEMIGVKYADKPKYLGTPVEEIIQP